MTKHCYNEMHGHLIEKDSENSEKNKGKISPFVTGRKTDSWCGEMIVISSILRELHRHDSQLQPSSSSSRPSPACHPNYQVRLSCIEKSVNSFI